MQQAQALAQVTIVSVDVVERVALDLALVRRNTVRVRLKQQKKRSNAMAPSRLTLGAYGAGACTIRS